MKNIYLLVLIAFASMMSTGCEEQQSNVEFIAKVKTNLGDPVPDATIVFGQEVVGVTDTSGNFKLTSKLNFNERVRVEIRKESDVYYFAPYFDGFVVKEDEKQKVDMVAVLYFVPKPNMDIADKDESQDTNSTVNDLDESVSKADEVEEVSSESELVASASNESQNQDTTVPADKNSSAVEVVDTSIEKIEAPKIAVTTVAKSEVVELKGAYPKIDRANKGPTIFTVMVTENHEPLGDAEIFVGRDSKRDLSSACTTNSRGRCVIRFEDKPKSVVSLVVKRKGYKTTSLSTRITNKGQIKFSMAKGKTIDIFAITKSFNFTRGLEEVAVLINGRTVGQTDKFGYYSFTYSGKKDDLVSVALRAMGFLPEIYETDFVASGPMTLVKFFNPKTPPSVRMVVLPVQPAGKVSKKDLRAFDGSVDKIISTAARTSVFSSTAFQEVQFTTFNRLAKQNGENLTRLQKEGWQATQLKSQIDALLLPTLVLNQSPYIELSVIDSRGRILAAAKEKLDGIDDSASINRSLIVLSQKINRAFPFEGAVLDKTSEFVQLNLGFGAGRSIKSGDTLDVHGIQTDKTGRSQTQKKIGEVTIVEVQDGFSKGKVTSLEPRSVIERGDLVVLRPRKAPSVDSAQVRVSTDSQGSALVSQANVYFNDYWIGATDEKGRLYVNIEGDGVLKIIKHGFRQYSKNLTLQKSTKIDIKLSRETGYIRISSKPSNAEILIEGRKIGKTPLSTPISVPTGFLKVELQAPNGYKNFKTVLELDEGTLDLTGANEIILERDIIAAAENLLAATKIEKAIERLLTIPKSHTDYLLAQHKIGEIYLTRLKNPAKAASAFSRVTQDPKVAQFSDKRFIGSHINEGVALFETAENIEGQPSVAIAHYQKAIEVLENVTPQLRFVPKNQYVQALHNVEYHMALSRYKVWTYTKDPVVLNQSIRAWKSYIDSNPNMANGDKSVQLYLNNAKIYYKQAMASKNSETKTR